MFKHTTDSKMGKQQKTNDTVYACQSYFRLAGKTSDVMPGENIAEYQDIQTVKELESKWEWGFYSD